MLLGRWEPDWFRRTTLVVTLLSAVANLLWGVADVRADGLRDIIKNLWGPEGILLEPTTQGPVNHQPHFTASSLQGLDSLNTALAASLANFSPSAAVTGFTFDVERGVPVSTQESLGPLLAQRAPTIGKGKLNFAVTYTRIRYSTFEGTPLDSLSLEFHHQDVNNDGILTGIETDTITANLDTTIDQDVLGLFATYGITPNWDVELVVPLQHISVGVTAHATINRNSGAVSYLVHNFDPNAVNSSPQDVRSSGSASGIGDVLLQTKYNFLRGDSRLPDMAIVGRVRLPTGDESDLLGTGETNVTALFVASKTIGWITPHLNLGYAVSTGGSSENNVQYVLGFDARLHPRVTLAAELLGVWKPEGTGVGDNLVDAALGVKVSLVRNFLVGANVAVPVNKDEGLRANAIWTIGAEYTF